MPGLLRAIGRTAVVAGTATAVSNRVSRRQAERWQSQESAYVPSRVTPDAAPPPAPAVDPITQLKELAELKQQGILTDQEFAQQKARILATT